MSQVEPIVPAGISDTDAIERTRRRRAGELCQLRIFPKWGLDCSLRTIGGAADPEHFNITPDLVACLRTWTAEWEELGSPFDAEDHTDAEDLTNGDEKD